MSQSTDLEEFLAFEHAYAPVRLDESSPEAIIIKQFTYNCRFGQIANNDTVRYYGQATYIIATRLAVTRFLIDDAKLSGSHLGWAIENLTWTFTRKELMGRAFASGVKMTDVQLLDNRAAETYAWLQSPNKHLPCPAIFSHLMDAVSWAADTSTGLDALIEHNYNQFLPAYKIALRSIHRETAVVKEVQIQRETQRRWTAEHNQGREHYQPLISEFARRFDTLPDIALETLFGAIKSSLPKHNSLVDSFGTLHQQFIFLSYLGFAVFDYYFRKRSDLFLPGHRASIIGGAHFAKVLRDIVVHDESLACIAVRIDLCSFPPKSSNQLKAQVLSAAIAQFFIDNPESVEGTMRRLMGTLVNMTFEIVSELDSQLLPTIPPHAPMEPLPYDSAVHLKSTFNAAEKTMQGPALGSTSKIVNAIAGPSSVTDERPKSRSKGFLSSLKATLRPFSSSITAHEEPSESTSLHPYLPRLDGPLLSKAARQERLLKSGQDAAKSAKQKPLKLKK